MRRPRAAEAARNVEDLHLLRLTKRYGDHAAVDDISLTVPAGSFFALLGPSGCGKTTTLRMVAGLEVPTQGLIRIGASDITGLRAYQRPVNTVFQSYALFPHMDVFDNVAFGLRRRGVRNVRAQVGEMLELVELGQLARRRPAQLSGGQQQRVAVARALINRPDVLLLDEPLGALDLKLRRQMQIELKRIQVEVGTTFVHVTHDQEEAMTMADSIAVMNEGRIEQLGAPREIYDAPRSAFAANFLGQSTLIPGTIIEVGDLLAVRAFDHTFRVPRAKSAATSERVILGVRPEKLAVHRPGGDVPAGHNSLSGVITDASFVGVSTQYLVACPWGQEIIAFEQNLSTGPRPGVGEQVVLSWDPSHTFGLDGDDDPSAGLGGDPRVPGPDDGTSVAGGSPRAAGRG
jgi:spermidine/putrescine transport system ATP-binding protein